MDEQILTMIDLLNPAGAEEHTNGGYEAVVEDVTIVNTNPTLIRCSVTTFNLS